MEYASCEQCNHSSRAADTAAAIMARLSPTNIVDDLELEEARGDLNVGDLGAFYDIIRCGHRFTASNPFVFAV